MDCHFCCSATESVHLGIQRAYCDTECLDAAITYSAWKKENHRPDEQQEPLYTESFHDIVMRTGGYPVQSSHRGGGFSFGPENTMYSFRKSVECGARLLELDLRLTKDKHLVIVHWSSVDSTTDGSGSVSEYTLEQLRKLDAAAKHETLKGTGIQIPTFKEFLDTFVPIADLLFFFDFKDMLTLRMGLKMIESYKIRNRFALGSVIGVPNAFLLKYSAKASQPRIPICTDITNSFKITLGYYLGLLDLYTFEHDVYGFVLCKATSAFWGCGLVDAIHERGCRVAVSGYGEELNKPERLRECLEYGVDFILTDRVDLLQQMMQSRKSFI